MSRGRRRHRTPDGRRPPKLPPPEHGIRVQQIGTTWWGERWVEALLRLGRDFAARMQRGRNYARQGRVHDLEVSGGVVRAYVTGSRPKPYRVRLALAPLDDQTWDRAIQAMAAKARFAAELLGGEMPRAIDEAFIAARASLFPLRARDLRTKCSCPDWANPCKHVAALHYVLAEAFDRDPFLLFELRGRSKDAVLTALRELRAGGAKTSTPTVPREQAEPAAPVETALAEHEALDEEAEMPIEAASDAAAYEAFRGPVEDLRFRIASPTTEGATLRQLGPPPGWSIKQPFGELVLPHVTRAALLARTLAEI